MRKFALLVGVEEYRDKMISGLQFARADATALAERLRGRCAFDDVRVLADHEGENAPDLVNIVTALRDTAAELRQEDLFLFFFAGHGVERDGHGFLLARDSLQAFPEHGSLSLELLRKTFERLRAGKRIILFDACRNSPEAGRSDASNRLGDAISRDIVTAARTSCSSDTTTVLLSACRTGQRAYEWPSKGHGVFTHYLLEGIDGKAWAGSTLDLRALAAYVADQVREWSSMMPGLEYPQEPWYEEFGHPGTMLIVRHEEAVPSGHIISSHTPEPCFSYEDQLRKSLARDIDECQAAIRSEQGSAPYIRAVYQTRLNDWQIAADRGWPEGQWLLGRCCEEGIGITKSEKNACNWYRKSAEQGFPLGQLAYGRCFADGTGVEQDIDEATEWYQKAADQGLDNAKKLVELHRKHAVVKRKMHIVERFNLGDISKDMIKEVVKFAEDGDDHMQYLLGMAYVRGNGVTKDDEKAEAWFRKAAAHGHAEAKKQVEMSDEIRHLKKEIHDLERGEDGDDGSSGQSGLSVTCPNCGRHRYTVPSEPGNYKFRCPNTKYVLGCGKYVLITVKSNGKIVVR